MNLLASIAQSGAAVGSSVLLGVMDTPQKLIIIWGIIVFLFLCSAVYFGLRFDNETWGGTGANRKIDDKKGLNHNNKGEPEQPTVQATTFKR